MYKTFFSKHLSEIQQYSNAVIFYKGFPKAFFGLARNYFEPFFEGGCLTERGLNVFSLEDKAKKLQARLLALEDGLFWATYEEYILLSNRFQDLKDNYDGEILVVENNFYRNLYPLEISSDITPRLLAYIKYMDSEEEQANPPEDVQCLLNYYGYLGNISNQLYCSYVNKDDQSHNIKALPYFSDFKMLDRSDVKTYADGDKGYIYPNYLDDTFYKLKETFHFGRMESCNDIKILLESTVFRNEYQREEISIFASICFKLGVKIKFSLEKPKFVKEYRPELLTILRNHWDGAADFRELNFYEDPDISIEKVKISQGSLIEEIVEQCEVAKADFNRCKDIFITSPTGSGKSVLFQIPAIYLAQMYQWMTIIVTPLIALMYDQVKALRDRGITYSAFINSDLSLDEKDRVIDDIKKGKISILYLSPELLLSNDIRNLIGERKVGLIVVDEAHLITTWGRDFRVDYWFLGNYFNRIRKYSIVEPFPLLALTATAVYHGPDDMILDTVDSLYMKNPQIFLGTVRRDEVSFEIAPLKIKGSHDDVKTQQTISQIKRFVDGGNKAIIYFPWVSQIKDVLTNLDSEYKPFVGYYYGGGGIDIYTKEDLMAKFKYGQIRVMLATKAFGMGIDISDINIIYHHAPSGNLCDYVQEIGRVARDKSIQGKAKVDFHANDLKFARILYGLSSMKQYQLNFMLQKTYDIYRINKKQNFLVSPEAYGYIFDTNADLEQKVKNGLLLLEKDFIKRFGYPVMLVRPRSLFSKCYVCVPETINDEFLASRYSKFAIPVSDIENNIRAQVRGYRGNDCAIKDLGDIFELNLKSIWENYFENYSFPQIKRLFFNKELFDFKEPIYPRYRFSVELVDSKDKTQVKLEEYFELLRQCFYEFAGKFFTKQEFTHLLGKKLDNEVLSRKIANVVLGLFVTDVNWGEAGKTYNPDEFIQKKVTTTGEEFRVIGRAFHGLKGNFLRHFDDLFRHTTSHTELLKYISYGDVKNSPIIKLAYIIEAMELGSYELSGGKNPEIFIRINDPYKIRVVLQRGQYRNAILTDIDRRHKKSIDIMKNFFTENYVDLERWDMIENYFLGRDFGKNDG